MRARTLCRTDLYFLLRYVMGRADMEHPWLFARCKEVERNPDGYLDLWAREHYKMQRLDEPTPTPDGWKAHGDLRVGDSVFAPDGSTTKVVALSPIYTDGDCYEIEFDDGTKIQCGGEHLWEVERRTRKRVKGTYKSDGIGKRLYRERVILKTTDIFKHDHLADSRLSIPVASSLKTDERDLPISPYLLGAWLGDGTSANGDITCGDEELFHYVSDEGYKVGHNKTPLRNSRTSRIVGLYQKLKSLNLIKNKHVPDIYLRASAEQRLALLQGLMDTDGHCNTRGTATFCNKNEKLIDAVFEIANSLGMKPSKYTYVAEHGKWWQVAFQAYQEKSPFKIKRKMARCKKGVRSSPRRMIVACERIASSPMRCIQVDRPDGMYLTSKSMIPTHNSTVITFARTIQDILRSHGDDALDKRECTVGIFSHTRPIAKGFLRQIKTEFENNKKLQELFPDILFSNPERDAPKWSEDGGLVVKRKSNPKESTVEAHGLVDGQPISVHFTHLIYDDVVVISSVNSPEMMQKTVDALSMSYSLGAEGGTKRFIGTRYHFNDAYKTVMDRGTAIPRIYPATKDGTMTGQPVLLSQDSLDKKRRDQGPYVYSSQMLLNPKADETQGMLREWVQDRHSGLSWKGMNTYLLFDPASAKKKTSDYTAGWAVGLNHDNRVYVLDMLRDRMNLPQRTAKLFEWHRKYEPREVRYEKYGKDSDIEHILEEQKKQNYRFEIKVVGGSTAKNDRIKRLIPYFEQGRIVLPRTMYYTGYDGKTNDLVHDFVEQELMGFPVGVHDDMLDALARLLEPDLPLLWPMKKKRSDSSSRNRGYTSWDQF